MLLFLEKWNNLTQEGSHWKCRDGTVGNIRTLSILSLGKHPFFMHRMAFSGDIMNTLMLGGTEEYGKTPCFYHVLSDIGL